MARKTGAVDLNTATVEELSKLRIIGPDRARKLVEYREKNGPYEDWSDLLNVEGFDEKTVNDIEDSEAFILGTEEEEEETGEEW